MFERFRSAPNAKAVTGAIYNGFWRLCKQNKLLIKWSGPAPMVSSFIDTLANLSQARGHIFIEGFRMLIVQISDLHISSPNTDTYGHAPMADKLQQCVDHINQFNPKPDVVLVSGDICDSGALDQTTRAAEILNQLTIPYYVIAGNHDLRQTMFETFGGEHCPARDDQFLQYVIDGFDVRMIGLDSVIPGKSGGEMCDDRVQWLDEQLALEPEKPTVLFLHHPPFKFSVPETDEDGFLGSDAFGDVVEKYSNIKRVMCGHIHLLTHASWRGTIVSTAPSMGMQLDLDLSMTKPSGFVLTDPAYLVHHWTPQKNLITHTITVRDYDGPFPFAAI